MISHIILSTGLRCERAIDECASNPCQNAGVCRDRHNMFTCTCAPGYVGSTCQVEIDECESDPCMNRGTCRDLVDAYTCICQPGFTGRSRIIMLERFRWFPTADSLQVDTLMGAHSVTFHKSLPPRPPAASVHHTPPQESIYISVFSNHINNATPYSPIRGPVTQSPVCLVTLRITLQSRNICFLHF